MNVYIDMDVAVDHQRKLYQVQLHTSLKVEQRDVDELNSYGTVNGTPLDMQDYDTVMNFRNLVESMNYLRHLVVNGYYPVGKGTEYPDIVLPSKAQLTVEKWK